MCTKPCIVGARLFKTRELTIRQGYYCENNSVQITQFATLNTKPFSSLVVKQKALQ